MAARTATFQVLHCLKLAPSLQSASIAAPGGAITVGQMAEWYDARCVGETRLWGVRRQRWEWGSERIRLLI